MASYDDLLNKANNYVANYNPNETANMNDTRLTNIETQRQNALSNTTNTYNNMINNTDQFYNRQSQIAQDYANKQQELQNAQTEQSIKEINQQREKTERDYQKEQRGAYSDYQKQINEYGVNAEVMASRGLSNTGYAESSKVSMYNAYQNRVATARQALQDSLLGFQNMIAQARLNNSTKLADIAYNLAQQQAQYALQGFQYKNTLIESRENRLENIENRYDTRYNNMLSQLNTEIAQRQNAYNTYANVITQERQRQQEQEQYERNLAWEQEQFRQQMAYQRERDAESDRQWQTEYNLKLQQLRASSSGSSRSRSSSGSRGSSSSSSLRVSGDENSGSSVSKPLSDNDVNNIRNALVSAIKIFQNSSSQETRERAKNDIDKFSDLIYQLKNSGKISDENAESLVRLIP